MRDQEKKKIVQANPKYTPTNTTQFQKRRTGKTHIRWLVEPNRANILGSDLVYLGLLEVEASAIEVLRHDGNPRRLGDDGEAALRGPAQEDLGGRLAVLLGQPDDQLVLHQRLEGLGVLEAEGEEAGGAEGGVGGDGDALGPAEAQQLLLHEVRVVLDLEGGGRDPRVPQHVVDQLRLEVGHADGPREPLVDERLHGRPRHVHRRAAAHHLGHAVVVPPPADTASPGPRT